MAKTTIDATDTWDLNEMLAVLCQVAQDASDAECGPEVSEKPRNAWEVPAAGLEGSTL